MLQYRKIFHHFSSDPFTFSNRAYCMSRIKYHIVVCYFSLLKEKEPIMITITDKARGILKRQSGEKNKYLRVLVKSGGCAGMTYDAELDSAPYDHERVIETDGDLIVISTEESVQFLDGLVIDYSDDLITAGFRFSNGNNDSSCGCGASFALAGFPEIGKEALSCGT